MKLNRLLHVSVMVIIFLIARDKVCSTPPCKYYLQIVPLWKVSGKPAPTILQPDVFTSGFFLFEIVL